MNSVPTTAGARLSPAAERPSAETASMDASVGAGRRVCHVIGSLNFGGAERQVVNLLNHLPQTERFVLLLDARVGEGLEDALDQGVVRANLPVRLRRLPLDILRVARLLRHWRIEVLHTHMFWGNLVGALAARAAGVPVVITSEHGRNEWKRSHHRWLERRVISPLVDLRICASADILKCRRDQDGIPERLLTCIPNGTDLPVLSRQCRSQVPVIGTVGRLVAVKNHQALIEAAADLQDAGLRFQLRIVGDGPERGRLQAEIDARNLGSVVELVGAQEDVASWLREFDIFVLPSIREGQPLALLEAMAHGVPVVASRVGGVPRTVEDGVEGYLVEPDRPEQLFQCLKALLADDQQRRRLGANARRRVEREFTIAGVATRIAGTYQTLWERKHAVAS